MGSRAPYRHQLCVDLTDPFLARGKLIDHPASRQSSAIAASSDRWLHRHGAAVLDRTQAGRTSCAVQQTAVAVHEVELGAGIVGWPVRSRLRSVRVADLATRQAAE
jgi:hypothetical protein